MDNQVQDNGPQIPGTCQTEIIDLILLDDLGEFAMDLIFVADDQLDTEVLLDEDRLLEAYAVEDKQGRFGLESGFIDNTGNLEQMLTFLFNRKVELNGIAAKKHKQIFELTAYKQDCISFDELETIYPKWVEMSDKENSMTAYGYLLGIIGYVRSNIEKNTLVVICEKRRHFL